MPSCRYERLRFPGRAKDPRTRFVYGVPGPGVELICADLPGTDGGQRGRAGNNMGY